MADKSLGVVGTAAAGIASTLLAAGALALFTYIWPNNEAAAWIVRVGKLAWSGFTAAGSTAWGIASYSVPVWLVVVVVAACCIVLLRAPVPALKLEPAHHRLLEVLVVADGDRVPVAVAAQTMGTRRLVVQGLAERLIATGLVSGDAHIEGDLYLTSAGRELAFAKELDGGPTLRGKLMEALEDYHGRV